MRIYQSRAPAEAGAVSLRIYEDQFVAPKGRDTICFANRTRVVKCENCTFVLAPATGGSVAICFANRLQTQVQFCVHSPAAAVCSANRNVPACGGRSREARALTVCTFVTAACRTRLWRVRCGLRGKPHQGCVMCKLHTRFCLRPSAAAVRKTDTRPLCGRTFLSGSLSRNEVFTSVLIFCLFRFLL